MGKNMAQVMARCSLQAAIFAKEETKNEVIDIILESSQVFIKSIKEKISNALDTFIEAYESYMEENMLQYNWYHRYKIVLAMIEEKEQAVKHLEEVLNAEDIDDEKIIDIIEFIQANI